MVASGLGQLDGCVQCSDEKGNTEAHLFGRHRRCGEDCQGVGGLSRVFRPRHVRLFGVGFGGRLREEQTYPLLSKQSAVFGCSRSIQRVLKIHIGVKVKCLITCADHRP